MPFKWDCVLFQVVRCVLAHSLKTDALIGIADLHGKQDRLDVHDMSMRIFPNLSFQDPA
jgi:hypothetical protein